MLEMKTDPIVKLVDDLPQTSITTRMLGGLDYIVPGEWESASGFDKLVRLVTDETDEDILKAVKVRAEELYNDPEAGYQKAVWLYQTVDMMDKALAAAALANKIGDKIGFLSFLSKLTPKSDMVQSIDLALKLTIELFSYTQINGLPRDGIQEFVTSLNDYTGDNVMRLATLICVDGLVPLGPDFVTKVTKVLEKAIPTDLEKSPLYKKIGDLIPGGGSDEKLGFVRRTFSSAKDWMDGFVSSKNLTTESVVSNLQSVIAFSDDKLDYVAAFIDVSTNYFEYTGIQSVAVHVIELAEDEVAEKISEQKKKDARLRRQEAAKLRIEKARRRHEDKRRKKEEAARLRQKEEALRLQKAEEARRQEEARQKELAEKQQKATPKPIKVKAEDKPKIKVRTYVVQRGDSLSKIAKQFYGGYGRWPEIYDANRDKIDNPELIYPGQELIIP